MDIDGVITGTIPQEFNNVRTAIVDQAETSSDCADINVISGGFYYYDEDEVKQEVSEGGCLNTWDTPTAIYLTTDTEITLGYAHG